MIVRLFHKDGITLGLEPAQESSPGLIETRVRVLEVAPNRFLDVCEAGQPFFRATPGDTLRLPLNADAAAVWLRARGFEECTPNEP